MADWALVIFTGLLALFTWRLWQTTRDLVEQTQQAATDQRAQMTETVKQATRAADASIASERAFVYVNTEASLAVNSTYSRFRKAPFYLSFVNLGRTPAQVRRIEWVFKIWEPGELDSLSAIPSGNTTPVHWWLGPAASTEAMAFGIDIVRSARFEQTSAIAAMVGKIHFTDAFDTDRETGFAFEIPLNGPILRVVQNPHLNYSH